MYTTDYVVVLSESYPILPANLHIAVVKKRLVGY